MTEVADRYARIAEGFAGRLAGVDPSAWSAPTPCTEWTARQVADHVVATHRRVLAALHGGEAAEPLPDENLLDSFAAARRDVLAALAVPTLANTTISGMFGEQPFESLVGRLLCADTLFHTWDLARATGQDERLDAQAVDKALEFLAPIDEAIRRPGGFGPKIDPPPGADAQARLLNFGGRAL